MKKLTRFVPVLLSIGALNGCSNATPAPSQFDNSAVDVNESLAALTASDPDQTLSAFDDVVKGAQNDATEDNEADAGTDEGKGGPGMKGGLNRLKNGKKPPSGRGHGIGLLLWYADLDALKLCQEKRANCPTSAADPATATCKDEVKACVKSVLDDAFTALCQERVAQCDASGRNEEGCGRIRNACGQGDPAAATGQHDGQGDGKGGGKGDGDKAAGESGEHGPAGGGAAGAGEGEERGEHAMGGAGGQETEHAKAGDGEHAMGGAGAREMEDASGSGEHTGAGGAGGSGGSDSAENSGG